MKFGGIGGTCTLKNPGKGRGLCYYSFDPEYFLLNFF